MKFTEACLGSVLILGSLFLPVGEAKAAVHWEKTVYASGKTEITYYDDQNGQTGTLKHHNQNPNIPHIRSVTGQIPGQPGVWFYVQCDSNPRILSGVIGLRTDITDYDRQNYKSYATFACSFNP